MEEVGVAAKTFESRATVASNLTNRRLRHILMIVSGEKIIPDDMVEKLKDLSLATYGFLPKTAVDQSFLECLEKEWNNELLTEIDKYDDEEMVEVDLQPSLRDLGRMVLYEDRFKSVHGSLLETKDFPRKEGDTCNITLSGVQYRLDAQNTPMDIDTPRGNHS